MSHLIQPNSSPNQPNSTRLYTAQEVCEMLGGISLTALAGLVKAGQMPKPVLKTSRLCRYNADAVDRALRGEA